MGDGAAGGARDDLEAAAGGALDDLEVSNVCLTDVPMDPVDDDDSDDSDDDGNDVENGRCFQGHGLIAPFKTLHFYLLYTTAIIITEVVQFFCIL